MLNDTYNEKHYIFIIYTSICKNYIFTKKDLKRQPIIKNI